MRFLCLVLSSGLLIGAEPPRIWDDAALKDWATPVAALGAGPGHYTAAEYYALPGDNLRTYPVYHPSREPEGYWEWLRKRKPALLVEKSKIRSERDWVEAGRRAFEDVDNPLFRTADDKIIARARHPEAFAGVQLLPDGSVINNRWVVTPEGVMLSSRECASCHFQIRADGAVEFGGPPGDLPEGVTTLGPKGTSTLVLALRSFFPGDSLTQLIWRQFTVPWGPDPRVERLKEKLPANLGMLFGPDPGGFARFHGSPWAMTKIPDLRVIRYSRYIDATATHRMRGAEDLARYAALVNGTDSMDFGEYRILTDQQRRLPFRFADEVLYSIGVYLMSLDAPRNPNPEPEELREAGWKIFGREGCVTCHVPPSYTSGKLTVARGYNPPADHPNSEDIVRISVGTDPELAMRTRKGTGFYKIPSLRGVWDRPRLLHDGSLKTLEEMFDSARLKPDYEPGGWKGPDGDRRGVPGHPFGLGLNSDEKRALLAFLRGL